MATSRPAMTRRELRRHIGQLLLAGFDGFAVPADLRWLIRQFDLAGVVLFPRNVDRPEQVAELVRELESCAVEWPLWVAVDQEGGRVLRLGAPFTQWPPMATLGRCGDFGLAERFARALAKELAAVGISLNFAPVLDVHSNPANPVIGDRALSDRADVVAQLGAVIIRTMQAEGVAACGKHFPGHGDTTTDSHVDLPVVEHPLDRLEQVEFVPFRAAIAAEVAAIMTAHVLVPALDEDRPATVSRRIVEGELRAKLGFTGLVVSDDLEMAALARTYPLERAAVAALAAGCDVVLVTAPSQERQALLLEALIHALEEGTLSDDQLREALARQCRAKARFLAKRHGRRPLHPRLLRAIVGAAEHQVVAEEMARFL
jgi:beta-N-acetylhexosaminidase